MPASPLKGRSCERELARLGIGCFFTSKRSIIKRMVYRAMALSRQIEAIGGTPLEVYPYATKVRIFGKPIPAKNTRAGLVFLRERVRGLLPSLEAPDEDLDHDQCDALLAAYTGYLHWKGQTETLGLSEEGVIVIPIKRGGPS